MNSFISSLTRNNTKKPILQTDTEVLEQAQACFNVAGVMLLATDLNHRITLINRKGCDILGIHADELTGSNWFETCIVQDQRDEIRKIYNQVIAGQNKFPGYFEYGIKIRSGSDRIISWNNSLLRDGNGAVTGILAAGEDITRRAKAERRLIREVDVRVSLNQLFDTSRLAESEDQLLHEVLAVITSFDFLGIENRGAILLTDPEIKTLELRAARNLTQKHQLSCREGNEDTCACRYAARTGRLQASLNPEHENMPACAGLANLGHIHIPIRNRGVVIGVIALYGLPDRIHSEEDILFFNVAAEIVSGALCRIRAQERIRKSSVEISRALKRETAARKGLEQAMTQVVEARKIAEEANRSRGEFLANMSHEIRTPLNGIQGFARLLSEENMTSLQQDYVRTIISSSESLLIIINDILDFSKIESGRMELESINFNLRSAIEDVVGTLASRAHEKQIGFILDLQPDMPNHGMGDPTRLRQILMNLIGNAIKFTNRGHVLIRVRTEELEPDFTQYQFEIIDSGIGIPEDRIDQLFRAFRQVDSSTTRRFGGSGLGLVIARNLTEAMGGSLAVHSVEDKGSTFTVNLTLPNSKETADHRGIQPEKIRGRRVLIGVADAYLQQTLIDQLDAWGCPSETARSESELMDRLAASVNDQPFNLLLVDFDLDGLDVISLPERVRSLGAPPDMRIAALTTLRNRKILDCINSDLNAYISMPVKQHHLYHCLLGDEKTAQPPVEISAEPPESDPAPRDNIRILLVEDNPVNQKLAKVILEKADYQVTLAENGQEALDAMENGNFALILMDCQMPVMDGYEATTAIRGGTLNPHIPIIGLTAHAMKGDREKCLDAGMSDYLPKPVKPNDLYDMITQWLKKTASEIIP